MDEQVHTRVVVYMHQYMQTRRADYAPEHQRSPAKQCKWAPLLCCSNVTQMRACHGRIMHAAASAHLHPPPGPPHPASPRVVVPTPGPLTIPIPCAQCTRCLLPVRTPVNTRAGPCHWQLASGCECITQFDGSGCLFACMRRMLVPLEWERVAA